MMAKVAHLEALDQEDAGSTDGRRQRSADSRRRIVQALLELVQAGELEPSAEAVAERAEVGLRSVFRHFKDMEGLRREMNQVVEARLRGLVAQPLTGDGWRERLDQLIDRRTQVFEQIMPYRRAANAQRHRSELIAAKSAELTHFLRAALEAVLPPGLDRVTLEAMDLALCLESWIRMRTDQGLTTDDARAVMRRNAEALLAGM